LKYAILNMKGGVGKTTTAVNLGAGLARLGKRVLVVDLDPQANATAWLSDGQAHAVTMANALADRRVTASAVIASTAAGVDLGVGSRTIAGVADDLRATSPTPGFAVRNALKQIPDYDVVLLDCPPGLGLLSVNALIAADALIVPIDSQTMALAGVTQIHETISELVDGDVIATAPKMQLLVTMYDSRISLDRAVSQHLKDEGFLHFAQPIRVNTRLAEAFGLHQSIFDYAPTSTGAADYDALARALA